MIVKSLATDELSDRRRATILRKTTEEIEREKKEEQEIEKLLIVSVEKTKVSFTNKSSTYNSSLNDNELRSVEDSYKSTSETQEQALTSSPIHEFDDDTTMFN